MTMMNQAHRVRGIERWALITYHLFHNDSQHVPCAYCGEACDGLTHESQLQMDHIVCRSQEVDLSLTNIIPICRDCNEHKADMPATVLEELIAAGLPDVFAMADEHDAIPHWIWEAGRYISRVGNNVAEQMELAFIFAQYGFDWVTQ